jgi:hypothetical protein
MTSKQMTKVKFVSTISKMGDKRIINIPRDFWDEVNKLNAKQVKVIIDDEI